MAIKNSESKSNTRRTTGAKPRTRTKNFRVNAKNISSQKDQSSETNKKTDSKNTIVVSRKQLLFGLLIIVIAFLAFNFRYLIVPAAVNGKPIFSWSYLQNLHKSYGSQVMNQLIAEEIIKQEAAKQAVFVSPEEVTSEIQTLSSQLSESGGLESFLASRGITEQELREQIRLNLVVKKLVASKINVTEEEINSEYQKNQEFFGELSEEEAKKQIKENFENQKLQQEINLWFDEQKQEANIEVFAPGLNVE